MNRSSNRQSRSVAPNAAALGEAREWFAPRSSPGPGRTGSGALTPREEEVLRLMAEGHASKHIAAALHISVNTVNNHRVAILKKLDVHSATAAVKCYWTARTAS